MNTRASARGKTKTRGSDATANRAVILELRHGWIRAARHQQTEELVVGRMTGTTPAVKATLHNNTKSHKGEEVAGDVEEDGTGGEQNSSRKPQPTQLR